MATGGFTPLLFAARRGDAMSAELLLTANADPNDVSADGTSALVVAAHSGNTDVAKVLLQHGADPNTAGSGYTALHAAVLRGDVPLVKALLMHGANPNARLVHGTTVRRFSQDYALEQGFVGATPFWLAAKFAEPEIMRILADAGADPFLAVQSKTPLMLAAGLFSARHAGAETDRRERRIEPLQAVPHDIEEETSLKAVKIALALGADVNASDTNGDTALHGAASRGFTNIVRTLVAAGASLEVRNSRGGNSLSSRQGSGYGRRDQIALSVARGSRVSARSGAIAHTVGFGRAGRLPPQASRSACPPRRQGLDCAAHQTRAERWPPDFTLPSPSSSSSPWVTYLADSFAKCLAVHIGIVYRRRSGIEDGHDAAFQLL